MAMSRAFAAVCTVLTGDKRTRETILFALTHTSDSG